VIPEAPARSDARLLMVVGGEERAHALAAHEGMIGGESVDPFASLDEELFGPG